VFFRKARPFLNRSRTLTLHIAPKTSTQPLHGTFQKIRSCEGAMRRAALLRLRFYSGLASHYDSAVVEHGWQTRTWPPPAGREERPVFSMVLPPPNVTGSLHLGHALTVAVEDAMVRRQRQLGSDSTWVPGLDHAGIATQVVVEKRLAPRTRHELGREAFVREVWQWKHQKELDILNQLRRMGLAFDWSRFAFTLDPGYAVAVTEAFCRLHERGLVYRAARGVQWCPALQSVLSDVEVEIVEQPGVLHLVSYGPGVSVATTRPETIYADVAVAVHPKDARYAGITECVNPLTGKRLPVVRDRYLVDPAVGTGAVKVTPAHSFEDYECGKRHRLPLNVTAFDDRGLMHAHTHVAGVDRIKSRDAVVKVLRDGGHYLGSQVQPNMRIPTCSRTGDVLEPSWKEQWYVNCRKMSSRALKYCEAIIPEKHQGEWRRFLSESRDWCISRQLWWGHRIPAYQVDGKWVVSREPPPRFERQDEDVLDTWFSSALFPLAAFGWPAALDSRRYPLSVMETGADILFFWVARMAMVCSEMEPALGCPFGRVVLHPMVRDKFGRKMSKSVGNVIDPLDLIEGKSLEALVAQAETNAGKLSPSELQKAVKFLRQEFPQGLPKCGADALRFALIDSDSGDSVNLDVANVVEASHMCNKIWNAAKFVRSRPKVALSPESKEGPAEQWLRGQMALLSNHMVAGFAGDKLHRCTKELKSFLLLFCNHYIEHAKLHDSPVTTHHLHEALDFFLIQLHPFMPFLTEHLMGAECSVAPVASATEAVNMEAAVEPYAHVIALVSTVRGVKSKRKQEFSVAVQLSGDANVDAAIGSNLGAVRRMTKVERIDLVARLSTTEDDVLLIPVRGKLSIAVSPKADAEESASTLAKLEKVREKLAKMDAKWCEEKAPPIARERHHKLRQVLVQQIASLQQGKEE
jgi:valyl-tRNA synthetase